MIRLRSRLEGGAGAESGLTLVELLVASMMGVILMGAVGSMVIGTIHAQPEISKRAQNITTARWVLARMTREIRNGVSVQTALSNEVSFKTYVRRTACGSTGTLASNKPAILCQVTYGCSTTTCSRIEAAPGENRHRETDLRRHRQQQRLHLQTKHRVPDLHRRHPPPAQSRRSLGPDDLRRRQPPERDPHQLRCPGDSTGRAGSRSSRWSSPRSS